MKPQGGLGASEVQPGVSCPMSLSDTSVAKGTLLPVSLWAQWFVVGKPPALLPALPCIQGQAVARPVPSTCSFLQTLTPEWGMSGEPDKRLFTVLVPNCPSLGGSGGGCALQGSRILSDFLKCHFPPFLG